MSAVKAADGAGTYTRAFEPAGFARKVMVECDRAKQVCDRNPQAFGHGAQRFLAEVSVALMESVQERKKWGGLRLGLCDQLVGGRRHSSLCNLGR